MTHPAIERFHQAQDSSGNPALRSVMEAVKRTDEGNMKLIVKADDLLNALAEAIKVVATPTFSPILSHVLLVTHQNSLILTCADLGTGISLTLPAQEVQCSGAYSVPAKLLLSCVKAFPQGKHLTIEVKESQLVLTGATQTFRLKGGGPACKFPPLWKTFCLDSACVIGSDAIKELPTLLTSVCLDIREDLVELVATDGQWLARRTMSRQGAQAGVQTRIQIPMESMRILTKILPKEEEVVIAWESERIIFQAGHVQVVTLQDSRALPDSTHLLSTADASTFFPLERSDLEQMLKSCKPFSKMITLSYHQGSVTLQCSHKNRGEVSLRVDTPMFGKSGQIFLHRQHLTDMLKKVMAKTFTFCVSPTTVMIAPDGREDCLFVEVTNQ